MKNFEYLAPTKVIFGKETHKNVGELIKSYGYKKILLLYGQGSIKKAGLYGDITSSLKAAGVEFGELGGIEPNPKLDFVKEAMASCKEGNYDLLLAAGGGSVIDTAKLMALCAVSDIEPWDFVLKSKLPEKSLPIGVILTIAASGSEMSSSCVISNTELQLKRGFNSEIFRPLFAILNPELTYSVNKFQTGNGIVDIMMHTMDRYFMDTETADLTDSLSEALLKSVISAGREVIANPLDYEARATLMWAGSVSHNDLTGLGRTFFMCNHKIEHELSGIYDFVSHGAGLSVVWPAWAKYVYKYDVPRFCRFATRVWNIEMDFEHPEKTALQGILATEEYFKSIGMPVRLSEFNIEGEIKMDEMADKCTAGDTITLTAPKQLNKEDIVNIFKLAE